MHPSRSLPVQVALAALLLAPSARGQEAGDDPRVFGPRPVQLEGWKADNVRHRDPRAGGWRTEVLHDLAKPRVKAFAKALLHPPHEGEGLGALAEYVDASFEGTTDLRPATLEPSFDDGSIRTRRWPGRGDADVELRPAEALPRLASALIGPFEGSEDVHADIKIVRVSETGEDTFDTVVVVQLYGSNPHGRMQLNMEWLVDWALHSDGDGETATIRRLELLSYDEVATAGEMFGEITAYAFSKHPFWDSEIRRGVDGYYNNIDRKTGNAFLGGQGLAIADVDGDGREDLFVCQQGGLPNRLFLRNEDGTTMDASEASRLAFLENTRGAIFVDVENDGDADLCAAVGSNVLIGLNDGTGKFGPFRIAASAVPADVFSVTAADPDGDGDLDLYGCRYVPGGIMGGVPLPYHDANNGAPNSFWRNDGEGNFVEATAEVGLDANNTKYSLASLWEDFDDDGDVDLYVTNDFGRNTLYRNDDGRFTEIGGPAGADDMAASMGISAADVDNDGDMDFHITNMFSSAGLRIVPQSDKFMDGENQELHRRYEHHARGNTLLLNDGDGTFTDVTARAGVALGRWGWGARFADFNNDGLEDVYCPNGFVTNQDPEDM